ncbi:MAG: hypothetical protein ACE5KM_19500, partial [Planctomycetaceae bacterium]
MTDALVPAKLRVAALLVAMVAGCSTSVSQDSGRSAEDTPSGEARDGSPSKPRSRKLRFKYGFKLTGLPARAKVRVWMPVPPSNRHQTVAELDRKLPAKATVAREAKYGNAMLYLEPRAPASGSLDFRVSYRVERTEVRSQLSAGKNAAITPDDRKRFLAPNAKVPLDGKP